MTERIGAAVTDSVAAATPDSAPPFAEVLQRRDRRRRRTRGLVAVGATAAVTATVIAVTTLGGPDRDRTAPPVATDGTTTPAADVTPNPSTHDRPPALVLGGAAGPVDAQQGSYCWGNACADYGIPQTEELPDVGQVVPLTVAFPMPGQWWFFVGRLDGGDGCSTYPVLAESVDDTHLQLTPSGPPGDRLAHYGVYSGGRDTSGFWRWTVPERDGVPQSWMTVTQNSPSSGGMADLKLIIDDAAVDGEVQAGVTVEAADGTAQTFPLPQVDQHCAGDGFVELAVSDGTPDRRIDGLGPAPYDYTVDLTIDGTSYTGTGTWSGEGTEHGGDARLTFEPALPALE